jgi:hypothetical protein
MQPYLDVPTCSPFPKQKQKLNSYMEVKGRSLHVNLHVNLHRLEILILIKKRKKIIQTVIIFFLSKMSLDMFRITSQIS